MRNGTVWYVPFINGAVLKEYVTKDIPPNPSEIVKKYGVIFCTTHLNTKGRPHIIEYRFHTSPRARWDNVE